MKCEMCKKEEAIAVARNRSLCSYCFYLISVDNKKRIKLGINIPTSFRVLKGDL